MNKKSEISILGFSSVASIVSLLLAEEEIEHSYYITALDSQFLSLQPLSNPIVNGPTRKMEEKFISNNYLTAVPSIKNYVSISYDESFNPYRNTSGKYTSETYAIDSRVRLQCFYDRLKKSPFVNLIENSAKQDSLMKSESLINIVGGGECFSKIFESIDSLPTQNFEKERDLFFFNLICNRAIYEKYSDKVTILYIGNTAEILIYPFLHPTQKQTLNLTVNIIKNGQWDSFENSMDCSSAFSKIIELFKVNLTELASDLKNCNLADDNFRVLTTKPYYNSPVQVLNRKLFLGVGDSISKSDPLIGQGYNSGVDNGVKLVDELKKYTHHKNIALLNKSYSEYASKIMRYLYHINKTITQSSDNVYLSELYDLAEKNTQLQDYLFSTYDDISLYFPWLIDQKETRKLIKKYEHIT